MVKARHTWEGEQTTPTTLIVPTVGETAAVCAGQGDEDAVQFCWKIRMSTATRSGSAFISQIMK
jgi:hypothetical protein